MVRVLNFVCVALMGLAILGLYRVSEATRVARVAAPYAYPIPTTILCAQTVGVE